MLEDLLADAVAVRASRPPLTDFGRPEVFPPSRPLYLVHDGHKWSLYEEGITDPPRSLAYGEGIIVRGADLAAVLRKYVDEAPRLG